MVMMMFGGVFLKVLLFLLYRLWVVMLVCLRVVRLCGCICLLGWLLVLYVLKFGGVRWLNMVLERMLW